jgi:alpha-galactosidase
MAASGIKRLSKREKRGTRLSYFLAAEKDATGAVAAPAPERVSRNLDLLAFDEIFDFAGLAPERRRDFSRRSGLAIFHQGFQSWSPGWELVGGERVGPVWLPPYRVVSLYIKRDRQAFPRGRIVSHFCVYLRSGDLYVALVSINQGTPPISFIVDRKRGTVLLEAYADGAVLEDGAKLAEIAVFSATGYFAFKDAFARLFDPARFERLSFLVPDKKPEGKGPRIGGWESWYDRYTRIDEDYLQGELVSLGKTPGLIRRLYADRGAPIVFQVDDGWERAIGDWRPRSDRFPGGMKALADRIRSEGYVPGLWLAPFIVSPSAPIVTERREWLLRYGGGGPGIAGSNPGWEGDFYALDLSRDDVLAYLEGLFAGIIDDWGYRYLKLDFLYAGMLHGAFASGGAAYAWYGRTLRALTARLKNRAGEEIAFLGCGAPLESSYRDLPLMRIGADTMEKWEYYKLKFIRHLGRPSAYVNLRDTIGRSFLDRTVFLNDPDVVFTRTKNIRLSRSEKELIAITDFLFGSQLMTSDPPSACDGEEQKLAESLARLFERLAGTEYGQRRLSRNAFLVFSRRGDSGGLINLSASYRVIRGSPRYAGPPFLPEKAILRNFRALGSALAFRPRSVSLFGS